MDEPRRRRKCSADDSDVLSDVSNEIVNKSVSEQGSDVDNSDYESLDEDHLNEEDAEIAAITANTNEDSEDKKLDDDEDRKNPQYIPKKGTFYEHDNRIGSETEEIIEKTPEIEEKPEIKRKIWKENDQWAHDKFDMQDQNPKSRDELVAAYGYDIRNEEGPPKARRRRRYGRGPNKYTRNWEDLEAYKPTRGRSSAELRGGRPRSHNITSETDFPSLQTSNENNSRRNYSEGLEGQEILPAGHADIGVNNSKTVSPTAAPHKREYRDQRDQGYRDNYQSHRGRGNFNRGGGRGDNRNYQQRYGRDNYTEGNYRGKSDYRNDRENYRGTYSNSRGSYRGSYSGQSNSADYKEDLKEVTDMLKSSQISPQKDDYRPIRNDNKKPNMPPRLQEKERSPKASPPSQSGDTEGQTKTTKRYSSQRQRGTIATEQSQTYQQHAYYEQEQPKHSTPSKNYPQPAYTSATTSFPAETYLPRVPVPQIMANAPRPHLIAGPPLTAPAPMTGVVAVPPALVGPAIGQTPGTASVPPYLTTENIINYGPTPALVAAPPQYPPFQTFTTLSQATPTEVYRNGVTYYSTQNQQQPRIAPPLQKRMKSAIPILPPPEEGELEMKTEEDIDSLDISEEVNDADSLSPRDDEEADVSGSRSLASDDLIYEDSIPAINDSSEAYLQEERFSDAASPTGGADTDPLESSDQYDDALRRPKDAHDTELPCENVATDANVHEEPSSLVPQPVSPEGHELSNRSLLDTSKDTFSGDDEPAECSQNESACDSSNVETPTEDSLSNENCPTEQNVNNITTENNSET